MLPQLYLRRQVQQRPTLCFRLAQFSSCSLTKLWSATTKLIVKGPTSPGDIHRVIRRVWPSSRCCNRRPICACGAAGRDRSRLRLTKAGLDRISGGNRIGAFGCGSSHPLDVLGESTGGRWLIQPPCGAPRPFTSDQSNPNRLIGGFGCHWVSSCGPRARSVAALGPVMGNM